MYQFFMLIGSYEHINDYPVTSRYFFFFLSADLLFSSILEVDRQSWLHGYALQLHYGESFTRKPVY